MDTEKFKNFITRWLISIAAVLVAEHTVSGITYKTWTDLVIATLILGILNYFIKPILMLFSLPLLVLTLGLFTLIINAILLLSVSYIVKGFHVDSFGSAFWGALVISIVTVILNFFAGVHSAKIKINRFKNHNQDNNNDNIIDV
ncbi:MAG: phage holin family protein [Verrucomicrobiae bacterium]|nr:phage holin family protein [Verrucomicrobiae bacterium]